MTCRKCGRAIERVRINARLVVWGHAENPKDQHHAPIPRPQMREQPAR